MRAHVAQRHVFRPPALADEISDPLPEPPDELRVLPRDQLQQEFYFIFRLTAVSPTGCSLCLLFFYFLLCLASSTLELVDKREDYGKYIGADPVWAERKALGR